MSYQQFGHVDPEERLDYAEEPAPGEDEAPRRSLPGALLVIGLMVTFAGGLWAAYHAGVKHGETTTVVNPPTNPAAQSSPAAPSSSAAAANAQVPLIRADTSPVKIKPDKVGGMAIPDRDDPIYAMRSNPNQAEHILGPPETPLPRPAAPPPAPPQVAAVQPPPAASAAQPALAPATPKPAPAAPPAAAGLPIKVQLASLRTPDEARDEWQRIKRENDDLLGKFSAVAVRADLGDRGIWYRVEVGPVGDRAAALRLCKALKDRNLGCQLVQ